MLVNGSLESLSSSTISVRDSSAGNCLVKRFMCPGNHDGGQGSGGSSRDGIMVVIEVKQGGMIRGR